jgi:hypothetical protein
MEAVAQATPLTSAPALAAAIRQTDRDIHLSPIYRVLHSSKVTPMYRIGGHGTKKEAQSAANVLTELADRLRRLESAYGEWKHFDAEAYFDLPSRQVSQLVKVSERVSTVRATIFMDLLLPSYQRAEAFWFRQFRRDYQALHNNLTYGTEPLPDVARFYEQSQPRMAAYWQHLLKVIRGARAALDADAGFLAVNGSEDERARWRKAWTQPPARGLDQTLMPLSQNIPTLTLSFDFPLPINRQPGRLRRLRANRERGRTRWLQPLRLSR